MSLRQFGAFLEEGSGRVGEQTEAADAEVAAQAAAAAAESQQMLEDAKRWDVGRLARQQEALERREKAMEKAKKSASHFACFLKEPPGVIDLR